MGEQPTSKDVEKLNIYANPGEAESVDKKQTETARAELGPEAKQLFPSLEGIHLTPEETAMLQGIAERIDAKSKQEALAEAQNSPENILINRLSKATEKLESAGLEEDAKMMRDKIGSITGLIDAAASAIESNPAEVSWFSGLGKEDTGRLDMLMSQDKLKPKGITSKSMVLDIDLGGGLRLDKSLGTYYTPENIDKYKDRIENNGGLEPMLSEQGLQMVLQELGLLQTGETPSKLNDEGVNRGQYFAQRQGAKENGQRPVYSYEKDFNGNMKKQLVVFFDSDFIISAALRKIESNKTGQA